MNPAPNSSPALQQFDSWLEQQIKDLSVDALSREAMTCTACPQVIGDYIIEYQGESLRFPAPKAYAFLRYVLDQ
ncbi:hypothetical protein PN498_14945 [Oscillatoria sp. CS-180]|uniref:hypothetical protein n=1 Tax=Oscillatoria sp. CS-180 TaxID=3021720 RepID=UPI00232BBA34|nr:hypothetical protein [Oscillatoria sp. CS-180]MDB9527295.1 hypothetical protein [Oscillatoria sp. CS-180]